MLDSREVADVCLWHKADITIAEQMSAFGGKADIRFD
jgi:hypothetical protein